MVKANPKMLHTCGGKLARRWIGEALHQLNLGAYGQLAVLRPGPKRSCKERLLFARDHVLLPKSQGGQPKSKGLSNLWCQIVYEDMSVYFGTLLAGEKVADASALLQLRR